MMKKIIRRPLTLLFTFILAFTLAACGGSEDKKDTDADTGAGSGATANKDSGASTAETSGKFTSIQNFIDSDLFREHLGPKIDDFEEKGLSMSFSAEDSRLIWDFKINDPNLSGAVEPASLESALDSQASVFESVADTLTTAVDVDNPIVLVRYLDSDGTELTSREFSATGSLPTGDSESADPDASAGSAAQNA